ncbi:endoplasmic reticulum lectin 1 isoform X1 [Bombus pascuorum]|uniref:endoplasmic reticulum lectin 1 isoform X1 n=1 Tax=Bombus pascuorum TaxID=65598 RepID=UPI00213BCE3A|nr:endoplasmic reticulum lectin 1 isoform X1 [Bombus pascuorum]XP_060821464.1 endoplasmic reticulum lectin 1 isoform X1 [Bombus pascuorum]XP_060821465.1 endoplasmic reticulum lectin 1 isoform X1 [Bombus pascuorum]XP_060821466.1 endoplasmic reticulum lectin 1 isoform X1 [Bombus pascuorum]
MWKYCNVYITIVLCTIIVVYGHDFRSFDDTVLFKINWPGRASSDLLESRTNVEPYIITTANKEQYQCLIVDNSEQEQGYNEPYNGPNPIEILSALFKQNTCSYRVESYWSYELCHGRYVRQYHEDRDGKKVKTQEYYLGTFDKLQELKLLAEYAERENVRKADIPVKKVDGINMPYIEVEMADGTVCDLTNKPRKIKVLYVCYQHGKHELFSLEEPSSCEYEVIVLSPWLCNHPDYKPQATGENEINCHPVENAPKKPRSLVAMEMESLKLRYQKVTDDKLQEVYAIFHVDKEGQDGEARVRVEIHPVGVTDKHNNIEDSINSLADQGISPAEASPVKNFLSGENCLHGGNGWWKYEFCYGHIIIQYHVERDGIKTILNLGKFNKQKHLDWIAAHPHKRPKSPELRKQLSHFYSDGTICDKTGNPRQTEVKLKCVESHTASPSSVSLFLVEPKTCEYVLGVESPLICDILEYADENGLVNEKLNVKFDDSKTTAFHEYDDLDEKIANGDD